MNQRRNWKKVLTLDANMYAYYHSLGRYQGVENYYKYINDENNAKIIQNIVEVLRKVAQNLNYDDAAVAREIAKFVQDCIAYAYDDVSTGSGWNIGDIPEDYQTTQAEFYLIP